MSALVLAAALATDAVLGEPRWLWSRVPHPAVLMGRGIGWAEARLNTPPFAMLKGVLLVAALLALSAGFGRLVNALPLAPLWETLIVAVLLAQRSLADHVMAVADALATSTTEGRRAVARIVGRDTADMDEPGIARAAIESAAENLSDGVVAPALAYLVFGLPGIVAYKAINTADSMIGYRTPRFEAFGWAAARTDDLFNLVPARLTALLIALLSGRPSAWRGIVADAGRHRSPNAGWPEAALSRALGVALSGPRSYAGEMRDFPFVNADGRLDVGPADIRASVAWLWRIWAALLAIVLASSLLT